MRNEGAAHIHRAPHFLCHANRIIWVVRSISGFDSE